MKHVKIKTLDGQFIVGDLCKTQLECDQFLSKMEEINLVRVFERQEIIPAKVEAREVEIQPEIRDEEGNVIQERIVETQEVIIEPEQVIVHPATHTYEIEDISEEVERNMALEKRARLRFFGERLIDEMSIKNSQLNLNLQQLKIIMTDEDCVFVRELLWTGSLESAKQVIQEKEQKFIQIFGQEYVHWILSRINAILSEF